MGRRDDYKKIMQHRRPDRLILDLGGCPLSSMDGSSMFRLMDHMGLPHAPPDRLPYGVTRRIDERVLRHLDIDTRSVGSMLLPSSVHSRTISADEYIDGWGIGWKHTGLYWEIVRRPLENATLEELLCYPWPDPDTISQQELDGYAREAQQLYEQTDYVLCAEHPVYGIFELGCWMCGFENFLIRMLEEPDFVHVFFERVTDYQVRVLRRYYAAVGSYIHYTSSGDDFATQANSFISPAMFDEFIYPYFKKRIDETRLHTDAAYLHHSCGNVSPLIPNLIRAGVQILNPIQPVGPSMQPAALKADFGDRIVFHGGLDTQQVLPQGTDDSIRDAVQALSAAMAGDGGYIFAAAHNIQEDVPPENVVSMFRHARNARY